jgi:hypothetical protein
VAINYGYREFPAGADERAALTKIIDEAWKQDIRYYTNQDTDIHPKVEQWSNGVNQGDELTRLMKVRRAALDRIGLSTIRPGTPTAMIEEPLVPIYMYHRYTVEAAASMIGGQDFTYSVRGDGRTPMEWVNGESQRKAIDALSTTLKASELAIPKTILDLLPPRPPGYGMHRELFPRTTGEGFDPINPAAIAADVTIGFVLQPDRAARMVAQNAMDQALPGLGEVIDRLTRATFDQPTSGGYEAEIRRATEKALVDRVTWLASAAPNAQVRAIASLKLQRLAARLRAETGRSESDLAAHTLMAADIRRFLERPAADQQRIVPTSPAPPGAPIGDMGQNWLARPPLCSWDETNPEAWLFYQPPY